MATRSKGKNKDANMGRGAAMLMLDNSARGATSRKAGGGTGDPGRHKKRAESPASTRKMRDAVRSGTTTAGKTKKAGSGGLASSMKNKQVMPSKATVAAEGSGDNARPSRKSTRRGANRVKQATQLTGRTKRAVRSPKARAGRSSAERARPRG